MKKILILFLLAIFSKGLAQVNDNCINAIPLCSNPSFTFFANSGPGSIVDFSTSSSVSNPTIDPFPPNFGCLKSGELNPQWLLLTIGNPGLLEFVFGAGNGANAQAGYYDWSMWPYSPTTCANIFNNTLPPIRCNWNGTSSGGTGLASASNATAVGGSTVNFSPPLAVNACQQFVICISNFSGVNTLVSFQSIGSASLSCNPNCNPNYSICYGSSATIVPVNFAALSTPVFSIQPGGFTSTTGSFVVTPTVTSSYTTFITGTNANNAVQTITAVSTVTVNAQPSAAPTVTNSTCTSTVNSVNLNVTFGPPGAATPVYTINWSPIPNTVSSPTQTAFNGGINAGSYNATITTANGCSAITNFSVNPLPAPAVIIVNPLGSTHSITCLSAVTLTAMNASYNYTWSSNVANFTGQVAPFTSTMVATWTLTAQNPTSGCMATQTFVIAENTITPVATSSPSLQSITCNINSIITVTASSNISVNITHQILAPQGGTFSASSQTVSYIPGGVGIYTHCVVNNVNGCSSCHTFTVTSNLGFPTYTVVSPQNYTLGCNSTSIAGINIVGGNTTPPGGSVSYTLIGPPTSSSTSSGSLSGTSNYSVSVPGTWTVITRDNLSFCETRTPISILSNTFAPDISAIVPRQILDCNVPRVTLQAQSLNGNVDYLWSFPANPGNLQGDTISVSTLTGSTSSSLIANYTLTITDKNSTCSSFSVIPMNQNLYPPKAVVSGGNSSLTCITSTVVLTNQSSTSIPPTIGFPYQSPVIGYLWEGPTPQEPRQIQSTYIAATAGIYTLTVKDLNNGCLAKATATIIDNRNFPSIIKENYPDTLDCGSISKTIVAQLVNGSTGLFYDWLAPAGATISPAPYTNSLVITKIGNYRVTVTNTINGCSSSGNLSVINGSLSADFEMQTTKGIAPLTVIFYNNSASSLGSAKINSYWNFGNGTSSVTTASNLSPNAIYTQPGTYKVTMYANKGTCLDTLSKLIEVEVPSVMEVPNVFTPNGDNVNDLFYLKVANLEEIIILIYDRWGHKVYDLVSDKGNIEWDGKNLYGKEAAEGTYFYIIKAKGKDGQSFEKKGTVSLYR